MYKVFELIFFNNILLKQEGDFLWLEIDVGVVANFTKEVFCRYDNNYYICEKLVNHSPDVKNVLSLFGKFNQVDNIYSI